MTDRLSKIDTDRWAAPTVLLAGALVSVILVAGYSWQISESDSSLSQAVSHAETAVFLQEASVEGDFAADLLGVYVLGGDELMIPRIQNQSTTALARFAGATSTSTSDEVQQIAAQSASIAAGASSVIALRQAGDAEAADQALAELRAEFETLGVSIQSAVDAELATAVSLTTSSHNADAAASWLLMTGISAAIATTAGILSAARHSLFRRRAPHNPSPA